MAPSKWQHNERRKYYIMQQYRKITIILGTVFALANTTQRIYAMENLQAELVEAHSPTIDLPNIYCQKANIKYLNTVSQVLSDHNSQCGRGDADCLGRIHLETIQAHKLHDIRMIALNLRRKNYQMHNNGIIPHKEKQDMDSGAEEFNKKLVLLTIREAILRESTNPN